MSTADSTADAPPPNNNNSAATTGNPYTSTTEDADIIHKLGRSTNTVAGDSPALRIFIFWREHVAYRKAGITEEEIEADCLEAMILLLCNWIGSTPIPKNCRYIDGNICPPASKENSDEPIPSLTRTVLVKYVGRIIAWLRRSFPNHPDFKYLKATDKQASPDWWSRIKPKLEDQIDDLYQRFDNDFSHGAVAVRPLYYNNYYGSIGKGDDSYRDIVSKIDLESMLKQLLKNAVVGDAPIPDGPLQHRAWLSILYNAIGRPGEVKFIDTSSWMYHSRFDTVDIKWLETKTKSVQAMTMYPDKLHYLLDFYHAVGSYFAVEGGLFRSEDQSSYATYLFPLLHGMADNSVANKILNTMRALLPDDMEKKLTQSYSGKSLRVASITELLIAAELSYPDVTGRSGHDSGTTLDTYEDKSNIATGMCGGKVLAHWSPDADVKVPKLDGLPTDSVYAMMDKLFTISSPMAAFGQGGELHMVLRTCMASLLMHHNRILFDNSTGGSSNAIVTKVLRAAQNANISDSRYPGKDPAYVLGKWSDEVSGRYKSENPDIVKASSDGARTAVAVNSQSNMLQTLVSEVSLMRREVKEKDSRIDAMIAQMQQLQMSNDRLAAALQQYEGTPGSAKKRKKATPSSTTTMAMEVVHEASTMAASSGTNTNTVAAAAAVAATAEATTIQPMQLIYSNTAKAVAMSGPKGVGVSISMLLTDFSIANRIAQGSWKEVGVKSNEYQEPQCLRNTLELCQFVCTSEEETSIRNGKSMDKESLLQLAKTIENKAFDKMWTLEGKDPETERNNSKKKGSQNSLKATYMAVGKRGECTSRNLLSIRGYVRLILHKDCSKTCAVVR